MKFLAADSYVSNGCLPGGTLILPLISIFSEGSEYNREIFVILHAYW